MNHIDTKCEEEKKARKDFADVKPGDPVVADDNLEATVRELLALRHKMDEDELQASRLKAVIMNAMGHADTLKNKKGAVLATWILGSENKNVNYAAIFKKYKVTAEDIEANTKYKRASRTFSIEELED